MKTRDKIKKGELIGEVGHSGNSTAPHLHFHLIDSADLLTAKGVPCSFKGYELHRHDKWVKVAPSNTVKIPDFDAANRRFAGFVFGACKKSLIFKHRKFIANKHCQKRSF